MFKKYWPILLLIVVVGIIFFFLRDKPTTIIEPLDTEIDSISVLEDSIDRRIDTITITIEKTLIQYEKDRNTIRNYSTNEDYVFFLDYIQSNRARLDSLDNI